MKNKKGQIFREWHWVVGGEKMSITECRQLKPVDEKLWGDMFYRIYEREDNKLFCYSEWHSKASEGCWALYCYL